MLQTFRAPEAVGTDSHEELFWSVDREFRLLAWNEALRQLVLRNKGVEPAVGMMPADLQPAEQAGLFPPLYLRAMQEGPFRLDYELPDHHILEVAFQPFFSAGQLQGVEVRTHDITERRQAAEAKYREFLQGAPEGIFQIGSDRSLLNINLAMARILGYDSVEECMAQIRDVRQDAWLEADERKALLRILEERGLAQGFECRMKRKDGSAVWLSLNIRLIPDANGRPLRYEGLAEDISERKALIEELRKRELRQRRIFQHSRSVMLLLDAGSGEIIDANKSAAAYYGYRQRQLIGMNIRDINILPAGEVASEMEQARLESRNYFNFRHRLASGEERDVEVYSSPIEIDGKAVLFSVVHDITGRKLAERKMQESEERYRSAFQTCLDSMSISELESGRIIDANETCLRIHGYSRAEVIGNSVFKLHFWADAGDRMKILEELARNGSCKDLEFKFRRRNGEIFWGLFSSTRLLLNGVPCMLSVTRDISERKAAEEQIAAATEALRSSERLYHTVFDTCLDALSLSRADSGEYLEVNRAFEEVSGWKREEAIGRTVLDLGTWYRLEDREIFLDKLCREGRCDSYECLMVTRAGRQAWVKISASLVELDGRQCILALTRDISESRAMESERAAANEAIRASEERYRMIFHSSLDAIGLSHAETGKYININDAYLSLFGYSSEEMIEKTANDLRIWVDPAERAQLFNCLRDRDVCREQNARFRRKSGQIFWGQISAARISLNGMPLILSVIRDLTPIKEAEDKLAQSARALQRSEDRYRTAFQTSLDAFMISHLETGEFFDVNPAFLEMLGYSREELLCHTSVDLNIWKEPEDRRRLVHALEQGESCRDLEFQWRRKDGNLIWVVISASYMEVADQPGLLAVVRDISASKAAAEEIRSLAFYDPLTHLPNRRLLLDRLQQFQALSSRTGHQSALLFIDLDNFKTLNDTLGHHVGDLLLLEVAKRMVKCVRKADTVGRLGGDEFIIILEELSTFEAEAATQARHVAEKILSAIHEPYQLGEHQYRSSASIGITIFGRTEQSANEILRQADIAMYQAKSRGRGNLHFFAPILQAAVNTRAALEEDLNQAICQQQFELFYQPQLDHARLISCEALVRWNHPVRGLLSPNDFIPLAEETGMILSLGSWVLEAACRQLKFWSQKPESAHLGLSVNISALQFQQPGFTERVLSALRETGADPAKLCLELTESTLLDSVDETITRIAELKAHGVSFALDDFGTGYSSLSYLKRLPLDQLKIDRSFIQDILLEASSGAIVQTIVALGRAIGLKVIAEGVETQPQRDFLARLGCHGFQGYLFSPPQSLQDFEAMWLSGNGR